MYQKIDSTSGVLKWYQTSTQTYSKKRYVRLGKWGKRRLYLSKFLQRDICKTTLEVAQINISRKALSQVNMTD